MDRHWLIFLFLAYCGVLARWGVAGDRRGWEVLAWFAFANFSLNWLILDRIDSDWIHVIAAMVDFLTIRTLLALSWNTFGKRQVMILGLFWLSHLAVYVDINIGTNLVYDNYEIYILALLIGQMTLGANGISFIYRNVRAKSHRYAPAWGNGIELDLDCNRLHKDSEEGPK